MSISPRLHLLGVLCLIGGILQVSDTPLDLWWSAPTSSVHTVARLIWAIAHLALIGGPIGIIARRFVSLDGWQWQELASPSLACSVRRAG